jgi:ADP-ribose pyrophosphatase YjhB (NUDIX family)
VAAGSVIRVRRRSARAILIDESGRLVLIKRTRPGRGTYWTTPGGGVEETDATPEAALHRELAEELGATVTHASQVLLLSSPSPDGLAIEHFFVARLVSLDESQRNGPEFSDPGRGTYEVDRVDVHTDGLTAVDLKPAALKEYILANREALLVEVGLAG